MNSSDVRLVRLIPTTGEGSFSRASEAIYWGSSGALQTAPPNTLRVTYDPADLSKAPYALIEQEATNSIRNNTMQGAVVGSPGTLPTNWALPLSSGLASQVVATGVVGGIEYIDLRIVGTPTATSSGIRLESGALDIPAAANQISVFSVFMAVVSGTLYSGMLVRLNTVFYSSSAAVLASESGPRLEEILRSDMVRYSYVSTPSPQNTAGVRPQVLLGHPAGVAIDFTLRIGLPQLERDRVTSPIRSTGTAATRAADVVGPGVGLVHSNVPITEPLWVAGTYALGAKVRDASRLVFESLVAGNMAPLTDKTKWLPKGATNRWRVFDRAVNSQTTAPGLLTFSVKPGGLATTAMILNAEGSSVTVSQSESGYVRTKSLVQHDAGTWYDFFYEEPIRSGDVVFDDIPPYPDSMLTFAVDNGPLDAKMGECLIGKPKTIGKAVADFSASALSYSTATTNTWGGIEMVKRYNVPRISVGVLIPAGFESAVFRVLREVTDVEIGIIIGDRYEMGIGFGFLGQWGVPKSGNGRTASIEFKGLV